MRKSTLVTIIALVGIAAIVIPLIVFLAVGNGSGEISTAPTDGMDFSFDDSDIAASYDESDVVSVIQGAPITSFPADDSSEESVPSSSEDESSAPLDSSEADNSSVSDSSSKAEDSSVSDNSSKAEDSSVSDNSSKAEDSSATEESSSVPQAEDIHIKTAGAYVIKDAIRMITVEVASTEKVQLILQNAVISNSDGPAIFIKSADKVTITADEGTQNYISDGSGYTLTSGTTNVDAAIFSLADLTVNGAGKLTVKGNKNHGIVSKDRVVVSECSLSITSKGIGLNGKDYVKIKDGAITINSGDDGISSDNAEDATRGYIYIEGGTVNITAVHDGIQAETILKSDVANITVKSGGGSSVPLGTETTESFKGLKAVSDILISGGTYNISSRDDSIHSNGTIHITGGTLTLSSANDGLHANTDIGVEGGTINVTNCFEGMDASTVSISGGDISINSTDDGIMSVSAFVISGGTLYIDSDGDGIDSNGTLQVRGGVMVISGPSTGLDGALDYTGSSIINGGVVVALGNDDYARGIGSSPAQGMAFCKFGEQKANTLITLRDADGKAIIAFNSSKAFSSAVISAPGLKKGNTYTLMAGGSAEGLNSFGFAQNVACQGGSQIMSITFSKTVFQGSAN